MTGVPDKLDHYDVTGKLPQAAHINHARMNKYQRILPINTCIVYQTGHNNEIEQGKL
jgi:hypothetical protein